MKKEISPPEAHSCPDSPRYEDLCNDYDCRPLPEGSSIPSGTLADVPRVGGGWGGITTRVKDSNATYHNSWMICAHQTPDCTASGDAVHHQPTLDGGDGYKIGEIAAIHPEYDVAIVEPTRGVDEDILPSPYLHDSTDIHNGGTWGPISNTMSRDAVDRWKSEEREVFRFGPSTCYDSGTVNSISEDYTVTGACHPTVAEVVRINDSATEEGDSGSLHWGYYEPEDIYLGIGLHVAGGNNDG